MKLEEEIQQSNFKNEYQKLAINLAYTYNWWSYQNQTFFKNVDITPQQFNVLRILRGQYPTPSNLKLIKERMLDRMSDASRIIDKLYSKGFVHRQSCPGDRRHVDLLISQEGLDLLQKLDFIDEEHKKSFGALTPDEARQLSNLLDKMRG
jgi:DNA-binding MarR family transcriptional regulator